MPSFPARGTGTGHGCGGKRMNYKRILTVQDISCVGQCSLTVALPILSACGHEACVLPTAVLSTHTGGFGKPVVLPMANSMEDIAEHWRRNGITFDAILTGYLGSVSAVCGVSRIMDTLLAPGGVKIVDPAMADHGKLYTGFDDAYVQAMRGLCDQADVILPNLTEATLLSGVSCGDAETLLNVLPNPTVILTGAGEGASGFVLKENGTCRSYAHRKLAGSFSGTGDIFAAAFTGAWMTGKPLYASAKIAADFTCRCIENTVKRPAHWYGVKFEPVLPELIEMLRQQ